MQHIDTNQVATTILEITVLILGEMVRRNSKNTQSVKNRVNKIDGTLDTEFVEHKLKSEKTHDMVAELLENSRNPK